MNTLQAIQAMIMIVRAVAGGMKLTQELVELAKKVQAGAEITDTELDAAAMQLSISIGRWHNAANEPVDPDTE